jgi:VanZ family protein
MGRNFKIISAARMAFKTAFVCWWFFMFAVTSLPGEFIPTNRFQNLDKEIHFILYFVLTLLFWFTVLGNHIKRGWWSPGRIIIVLISYAALDETLQLFIAGRHAVFDDFLANLAGISMGIVCVIMFRRIVYLITG